MRGLPLLPGTDETGHRCGGAVREEDEERVRGEHDAGGDGETAELRRPEMTDDRGVGQDVERFGDECTEGGHGETEYLAIVIADAQPPSIHATSCRSSLRLT